MFRTRTLPGLIPILGLMAPSLPAGEPTFHRDVEPILQKHCQDCHRPGQVAPFSLLTYAQAKKRASDIAAITSERKMPPWHASTTEGGPFKDARVLSAREIATLADWAEAGGPQGDPKDAPPARIYASDWPLGEPDLVVTMPESYTLSPDGRDEYRVFVIPTNLKEGRWVKSVDFRPGNPRVVHHVLAAFDTRGQARKMDEADAGPGYKTFAGFGTTPGGLPFFPSGGLGGWAPGKAPRHLPTGVGRYLPPGADVLLQVHYHKNGKAESDASSIALYFAKEPIDKQIVSGVVMPARPGPLSRPKLLIPAGHENYEVTGSFVLPYDAHVTAVVPHMHLLGKDFLMTAALPDGTKRTLIKVERWDFNWQSTYEFTEPAALPKGARLEMTAHFDNSAKNPFNPQSPPRDVHWGEQTTDEMCIGFLQLTRDDEHLENKPPARPPLPANFEGRRAAGLLRGGAARDSRP